MSELVLDAPQRRNHGARSEFDERLGKAPHSDQPRQGYDIVHFAGHAIFAEGPKGDGRGYLVFSGHPRPQAVPIAAVATWLADAGVQLVYLSCCRSSAALVALEFARNNIPMAIGFHWDVDDSKAPVFAKEFYQELLKSRLKVCPAISRARLNLFNGSPEATRSGRRPC